MEHSVSNFDLELCRHQFPSLNQKINGQPVIYLDGPAGSQVPQPVIDAVSNYYKKSNANTLGHFKTSIETDHIILDARCKMALFLNAENEKTISFGQNMTTLTYSLSKAIGRMLEPGDEIVITQLDHEANRGPWLALEAEGKVKIREVRMLQNGSLDDEDFEEKVNEKTRLIALGYCSNALGTVNNVSFARDLADKFGALLLLDAVHYAAHFPVDVQDIGCDFLLCSAYKFYGPHVGILYSKPGLLEKISPDRLITQDQEAPYLIETGTLNHAAIAGVAAAVDFLKGFGSGSTGREQLVSGMELIAAYEHQLGKILYDGLCALDIALQGPDFEFRDRAPTISFYTPALSARDLCKYLGNEGIYAWDGHFYATRTIEVLGLLEKGGVTRLGILMYNSEEEIQRTLETIGRALND